MNIHDFKPITVVIIVILLVLGTAGCYSSDDKKKSDKRKGFDLETLSPPIPTILNFESPGLEPEPKINATYNKPVHNVMVIWYFEKNEIYTDFGGTLKLFIKNNNTKNIYVYRIGIKPDWYSGKFNGVFEDTGKYVSPGAEEYVGMLYFRGPRSSGEFEYSITFSLFVQNETGIWNDYGIQDGTPKSITATSTTKASKYKTYNNLPQYYDKINQVVEPNNAQIFNLSHEIARNYSGPFNIYQACALYDYVSIEIKYFSDPSNTENYWCTPEQTLYYGGDCEDHSTLLASMLIALGGAVRMFMTDSHAFLGLYIGDATNIDQIITSVRAYYRTDVNLFWYEDELGYWLIVDTIGSIYLGGLPLGTVPIEEQHLGSANINYWSWDFSETKNLYITDIIPK